MNSLKEVKPLIEWENYLGVWMVDLLPKQHLVEYTKIEAFEKIGASNIRDWTIRESSLYNQLIYNNGILCLEHKEYSVKDNRKRSLIEWEKELGFIIANIDNSSHLEYCTKEEAIQRLYGSYLVRSWDEYADNIYLEYLNGMLHPKKTQEEKLVIKDFECVDVKPINNSKSANISNVNIKKKDSMFKKISSIKTKLSEKIEEKIIKINNKNNKIKVRKNGFKAFVSLTLSLVTAVSMYGFSKMKPAYDNSVQKLSCIDEVDDDIINLNENLIFSDYQKDNILFNNYQKENVFNNEIKDNLDLFKAKEDNKKNVSVKQDIDNKVKCVKEVVNTNKESDVIFKIDSDFNLGDKIILIDGSKVYDNVYGAIDKKDGYQTYYSYDTCRNINFLALNYNGTIIYSNNNSEVSKYKSMGAKVVSVCTDDGYYNAGDIVKVKSKKR